MVCLQIINKILKSKDPAIILDNDLTESHFIGYESHYNFIMDHYRRYGNVPDISTFLENFEDFEIVDVYESDSYLVDKINEEYLYTQMVPIIQKTADILTKNNSIDAYEFLKSSLITLTPKSSNIGTDIISNARIRYEDYIAKRDSETPWMWPTGFKELDDAIGGFGKGEEFVVIVARTNQGKSWVLAKIAQHNWRMGANVGYVSPEMGSSKIGYRFDTLNEHFSNYDLYRGNNIGTYEDYIDCLQKDAKNIFNVATYIDFNKRITASKLRSYCIQNNLDMLLIDGITYLTDERYRKGDNKTTSLTNISEDLMELSNELKIPIIVVVQSNRSGVMENGAPELESIRDSDGIAHNATKVLSIRQKNGKLLIEVKKNRDGAVGAKLHYDWEIDTGNFEYNPNADEYSEETDNTPYTEAKKGSDHSKPKIVNKQPLRRTTSSEEFNF